MTTGLTDVKVTTVAGGPDGTPLALRLSEVLGPRWWDCATHGRGQSNAWGCPECVRELRAENARLRRAMQWLEDKARERKLEIAPSLLGTGFEFGFWPTGEARVVNAKSLLEAVEAAGTMPAAAPTTTLERAKRFWREAVFKDDADGGM